MPEYAPADCGRAVAALDNGRALNLSEQLEARTIAARLRPAVTATLPNNTSGPAAASPNWLTGRERYDPCAVSVTHYRIVTAEGPR